jgi:hypothetical protein
LQQEYARNSRRITVSQRKRLLTPSEQLARVSDVRLNANMRGGVVFVLLGLTALVSYSLGRQDAPTGKVVPAVVVQAPMSSDSMVALSVPAADPSPSPENGQRRAIQPPEPSPQEKAVRDDPKRKAEVALTTAAIVALIIKASRDRYYATGHPCACPEDRTRSGRRCGGNSAYSRAGEAVPLCYPTDVTASMIDNYRKAATASR